MILFVTRPSRCGLVDRVIAGAVVLAGFVGAADGDHITVTDVGALPRYTVENQHVTGLLNHSNFTFVGRSNPQGPYGNTSRNWTDVYGYTCDGTNPDFQGRRYAYASTGGFGRTGNFTSTHQGGVVIFDVTDFGDPHYLGTYLPPCDTSGCSYLIRDVEIHDGIGYFASDRSTSKNGGVFVAGSAARSRQPHALGTSEQHVFFRPQ